MDEVRGGFRSGVGVVEEGGEFIGGWREVGVAGDRAQGWGIVGDVGGIGSRGGFPVCWGFRSD